MQDDNLLRMKQCLRCEKFKELDAFNKRSIQPDGHDYYCRICKSEMGKLYKESHKAEKAVVDKAYREANKEELRKYFTEYRRVERQTNPMARLKNNLRRRIHKALKGVAKSAATVDLLGASIDDVKKHIESKFQAGMSWKNYGKWHVDHVIPLASAKNNERLIQLFHYSNLQPLWALDNIRKSDNYEGNQ